MRPLSSVISQLMSGWPWTKAPMLQPPPSFDELQLLICCVLSALWFHVLDVDRVNSAYIQLLKSTTYSAKQLESSSRDDKPGEADLSAGTVLLCPTRMLIRITHKQIHVCNRP